MKHAHFTEIQHASQVAIRNHDQLSSEADTNLTLSLNSVRTFDRKDLALTLNCVEYYYLQG